MSKIIIIVAAIFGALSLPVMAQQTEETPQIKIVEIQTASSLDASQEFVELFNPSLRAVDVAGWKLQYKSANGSNWQTKSTLDGQIIGRARFLIATLELEASQTMNSGLAKGGGHLQLLSSEDQSIDLVGWGTATLPEGDAAEAPDSGMSLKRQVDEDGYFEDSGNNLADFFVSASPSPHFDEVVVSEPTEQTDDPEAPVEAPQTGNTTTTTPDPQQTSSRASYPKAQITELFIDPQKPLSDDEDEFIEIYNPNSQSIDLTGYQLQTGDTYRYSFTLPKIELGPSKYLAVFSVDSNLTLSNTSGRARLLNPAGDVIFETAPYEKAKAGQSWALNGGSWGWSETPSPGRANSSIAAGSDSSLEDNSDGVLAGSVSGEEGSGGGAQERKVYQEPPIAPDNQLNKTVLAGVGLIALLYAGYEYRHDISNRFNQLRRYFTNRRQNRKEA